MYFCLFVFSHLFHATRFTDKSAMCVISQSQLSSLSHTSTFRGLLQDLKAICHTYYTAEMLLKYRITQFIPGDVFTSGAERKGSFKSK